MTPDPHPDTPLDETELAVLAVVDDEASAEQRRLVARDPALVARVRAERDAASAIATTVTGPGDDLLAAIRARALDEGLAPADGHGDDARADTPATMMPTRDEVGARRERKARRLPPLPAVAAVVFALLLVGGFLLVNDVGSDADQSADGSSADVGGGDAGQSESGDEAATADADEGGFGETDGADPEQPASAGERSPAQEALDALLGRTTASYPDQAALLDDLRRVSPDDLGALSVRPPGLTPDNDDAPTTSSPAPGSAGGGIALLPTDPDVVRCDTVLRSAEDGLGEATAALLVDVDGTPVLVLSNPIESGEAEGATVRFTVFSALDCVPLAAVQR